MRRLQGSCHCGDIRYAVELAAAPTTHRCNCSICVRFRYWFTAVPAAAVKLERGQPSDYRFGAGAIAHRFCPRCGVKVFGQSTAETSDGTLYVNVTTLDLAPEELAALPVGYHDGRHDRSAPPPITSYL